MRVLLAHDGSPEAAVAARLAASLPLPERSAIRVLGVTEGDLPALAEFDRRRAPSGGLPDVEKALDDVLAGVRRPGVVGDRVVRSGRPAAAIVAEAEAFEAQIVVMGSRGLGRIRSLLVGSVAREVVDRSPCPVLVARAASIREVLLASDGSPASAAATQAVARWPMFDDARIHVLAVGAARAPDVADELAGTLRATGREATAHARGGDPARAILAIAEAGSIDLIVLGSRGLTGLRRALLGSVTERVLAAARASVLIVPPSGRGSVEPARDADRPAPSAPPG